MSFTEPSLWLQPPDSHTSKVQCFRHIPISGKEGRGGVKGRERWKREDDLQKYSPAVRPAVRGTAHPKGGVYYKGKGKETGTLHPVSCCEPIFLFCMPGQRIVCSSQIASNQFRAVMRANKLPRPPAVLGNSRLSWRGVHKEESWSGDFSFSLCLFPPLATSLILTPRPQGAVYKRNESKERLKPYEFHSPRTLKRHQMDSLM